MSIWRRARTGAIRQKPATMDADGAWKPKAMNIPDYMPKYRGIKPPTHNTDPWDCDKCRQHGRCELHASMEADGTKPPARRY